MIAAATPCTARALSSAALVPAERTQREQGGTDDEHPATPQEVGGAPAQQQQPAEGQQVGAQHPLQIPGRERQVRVDRGQRDDHDR
jgi:cell envelope opacity-associated protein A